MKVTRKWILMSVVGLFGILFLMFCREKNDFILLPLIEREMKLRDMPEWQSFIESWEKCVKFDTLHGNLKEFQKQSKALWQDCFQKTKSFTYLAKMGLISKPEVKAIKDYLISRVELKPQAAPYELPDDKFLWPKVLEARYQEKSYQYCKEKISLLENLAQQGDCINWVREYWVMPLKQHLERIKLIRPEDLKYWKKPVPMKDIKTLMQKLQKAFKSLEKPGSLQLQKE